jgi:membrane protein
MIRLAGAASVLLVFRLLGRAVAAWWNDNILRLGASVAYYTLFATAPILLIAIAIAGAVFGDEAVRGEIVGQIDGLVGRDGGAAVQALLEGARSKEGNVLAATIGALTSLLAACGVFLELQAALNTVWGVQPDPGGSLLRGFMLARARSFGLVLAVGFLLLVSLAVSAGLAGLGAWLARWLPGIPELLSAIDWLLSVAVTAVLFALLFKVLPDVALTWQDVAVGGIVTAVLFTAGKYLIGLYLGQSGSASSYGAVGSVVVLLLWVYYSAQILLIGAEFTRFYTERAIGRHPAPTEFGRPA